MNWFKRWRVARLEKRLQWLQDNFEHWETAPRTPETMSWMGWREREIREIELKIAELKNLPAPPINPMYMAPR